MGTKHDMLFFAGEHTVEGSEGWQCAHGAANSDLRAASYIITPDSSQDSILSRFPSVSYLPHPPMKTQSISPADSSQITRKEVSRLRSELFPFVSVRRR